MLNHITPRECVCVLFAYHKKFNSDKMAQNTSENITEMHYDNALDQSLHF